MKIVKKYLCN